MNWLSASLALWLALVASASGALAEPRVPIEMWLRKAGGPAEARVNLTTIDIAGLEFSEIDAYDLQYGKIVRVRGLHLRELMAVFKPIPETIDTMLLHFRGGMVVPVSIAMLRRNLEIFVAVALRDGKAWRADFPNAPGEDKVEIAFHGNKLVVGAEWRQSDNDFTPWRHVGSLKGIEFVEGAAYFAQWQPASGPKKLDGHLVYGQRCQFCHGISGIGAASGPDFVRVMNGFGLAQSKKPWRRLLEQVRDPRGFGPNKVHRMPDQADFKESEAKALVEWVEAVAERTPSFYEPSFAKTPQR